MPSVNPDDLKIQVVNSLLLVLQFIRVSDQQLPVLVGNANLPNHVDIDNISAIFQDGCLEINLPYTPASSGRNKEIHIQRY